VGETGLEIKLQGESKKGPKSCKWTLRPVEANNCVIRENKIKSYSEHYSFKYTNKMQPYTIFFITVSAVHVSRGFSAHHQELKTVHTECDIRQACLLLPLEWVSCSNSPTLAVAASKLDVYQILCVQI